MTTFAGYFLLATWIYLLGQLLVIVAAYRRVRLGAPREEGSLENPQDRRQRVARPSDAAEARRGVGREAKEPQLVS